MHSTDRTTPGQGPDALSGVALVTGGGRGVGASIAGALAQAGMRVAVLARTAAEVAAVAKSIDGLPVVADVTAEEEVRKAVELVEAELGAITLLVNNAGIGGKHLPSWECDVESWWRIFEVNVLGAFLPTRAVLPGMIERRHGRIISVGSGAWYSPPSGVSPLGAGYGASKAALGRFTELLAAEAAPFGVRTFTISPGYFASEMTRQFPGDTAWTDPALVGRLARVLASGRADALSGRYFHAQFDDIEALIAEGDAIIAADSHVVRLKK